LKPGTNIIQPFRKKRSVLRTNENQHLQDMYLAKEILKLIIYKHLLIVNKILCNYSVFGKTYHAVHVSFARTVSFGHLPEAHSIMNCILLPKTE